MPIPQPPKIVGDRPVIAAGSKIQFSSESGVVYYTSDGTDPRAPGGAPHEKARLAAGLSRVPLVTEHASARATVPKDGTMDRQWMRPDFNDSKWIVGKTCIGFDEERTYRNRIGLDLIRQMSGQRTSAYIRIPFEVAGDPASFEALTLWMACDDGFVAWINGTRIASHRAPASLSWNAQASAKGSDSETVRPTRYTLDAPVKLLRKGRNLLAIQGLNGSPTSSDFLIDPRLEAGVRASNSTLTVDAGMKIVARTLDSEIWSTPTSLTVEER